jgi:hypothetical protein
VGFIKSDDEAFRIHFGICENKLCLHYAGFVELSLESLESLANAALKHETVIHSSSLCCLHLTHCAELSKHSKTPPFGAIIYGTLYRLAERYKLFTDSCQCFDVNFL